MHMAYFRTVNRGDGNTCGDFRPRPNVGLHNATDVRCGPDANASISGVVTK